jgi:hypothetical protein
MRSSHHRHRALLTRMRKLVAPAPPASLSSRHALLVCERSSRMATAHQPRRTMPTCMRNVVSHAHRTSPSSRHAHWRAERQLERCEQPNQRLQRTALCAHEIVAFLKARISSIVFSTYWCAAAEAQHVGRLPSKSVISKSVPSNYNRKWSSSNAISPPPA